MPHGTSSLSYTQNGSTYDPFQLHRLSLIHRVSDTPYPSIAPSWRRAWQEVIPFFAFPPAVRKIIYTTNAIESLNRVI
ncbi:transposase, partial [Sulfitobacter sediminilitoris]|uniref:transposase n=1 Tax=Sulfitobacter sediminilitoris TaxID=2698830 RepID=UPI0022A6E38C